MRKKGSLVFQVNQKLNSLKRFNKSRHEDKKQKIAATGIYSLNTFKCYQRECIKFAKYCKSRFKSKTLNDIRNHVCDYVYYLKSNDYSNHSIKTVISAISKMYKDFDTNQLYAELNEKHYPELTLKETKELFLKHRADITRSRSSKEEGRYNKNDIKNTTVIKFAEATGLRRAELENLLPERIIKKDDGVYIWLPSSAYCKQHNIVPSHTKGGRGRIVKVLPEYESFVLSVKDFACPNTKIFGKIKNNIDIHSRRALYANKIYAMYKRPIQLIKNNSCVIKDGKFIKELKDKSGNKSSVYYAKNDLKGYAFDRVALFEVSKNLGHNRENVFVANYFRA